MISTPSQNILFVLLSDLPERVTEVDARDATIIAHATKLMTELNERHFLPECEARFLLLFRKRIWSPSENKYLGWERKRGKITEFNRLILGETNTTFEILVGNRVQLLGLKYVITLDGDTSLPRNVARELIGAIAHPLNRAIFDPQKNIVVEGYGLIQPRVSISMMSACKSRFSNTFLGQVGLDPYTTLTSDVYQDLFLEGSYVGKGIYDVQSFERALSGRVPDGTL